MASPAGSTSQEYWRPSNPDVARLIPQVRGICWRCGMDYSPGARYCSFCGGAREALSAEPTPIRPQSEVVKKRVKLWRAGLSLPSFVCLAAALVFALAAVLTGVVYQQSTWVDWQAVQTWRMEWLLGAIVALLAGILLKKKQLLD
jgi:hypothetical protein